MCKEYTPGDGERIDDIGFGGLRLLQRPEDFCYGVDAVLLADFASGLTKGRDVAIDLGTGTGVIPVILSHKTDISAIYGVEVQKQSFNCAQRNIILNGLEGRLRFVQGDIKDLAKQCYKGTLIEGILGKADMVCTNPPYVAQQGGLSGKSDARSIARQESTAQLADFIECAADLLKPGGDFFIIHRPVRLVDIFTDCRNFKLEPKTLRLVLPCEGSSPVMVLVHCRKGAGRELKILPSLCVREGDGSYTAKIQEIYERSTAI